MQSRQIFCATKSPNLLYIPVCICLISIKNKNTFSTFILFCIILVKQEMKHQTTTYGKVSSEDCRLSSHHGHSIFPLCTATDWCYFSKLSIIVKYSICVIFEISVGLFISLMCGTSVTRVYDFLNELAGWSIPMFCDTREPKGSYICMYIWSTYQH